MVCPMCDPAGDWSELGLALLGMVPDHIGDYGEHIRALGQRTAETMQRCAEVQSEGRRIGRRSRLDSARVDMIQATARYEAHVYATVSTNPLGEIVVDSLAKLTGIDATELHRANRNGSVALLTRMAISATPVP